jgi:hypothetical protein
MINRFDKIASSWDIKPDRVIIAEKFASMVLQFIRNKDCATALEYGCGTANVSFCLRDCFDKIILTDASIHKMKRENTGISKTYPLFMMIAKKMNSN